MAKTYALVSLLTLLALAGGTQALDEPFPLRVGESRDFEEAGLALRFTEITSDSRCPIGVNCLVAGEARLVFQAEFGSESLELLFQVPPAGSDKQTFDRYSVTVTAFEPQTVEGRNIAVSDYVATLLVTVQNP